MLVHKDKLNFEEYLKFEGDSQTFIILFHLILQFNGPITSCDIP